MKKTTTSLTLLLAAAALLAPPRLGATVLNISPVSDVRGSDVLLRDIVAVHDDLPGEWQKRPVLPAPEPGKSRNIPLSAIAYALQQYPDMHQVVLRGASQTRVRRTETALGGDAIAIEVKRYIEESSPWKDEQVDASITPPARQLRLPEGHASVRVKGFRDDPRAAYQYIFDVVIEVDGVPARSLEAQARILPVREVWVAARPLTPGTIISESDLSAMPLPVEINGGSRIQASESVAGLEVARSLKPGQPVMRQHLLPRLCASRGDTIAITASTGNIAITLAARALSSGRLGDVITCENISSKRRVLVRLTNPKEATTDMSPIMENSP